MIPAKQLSDLLNSINELFEPIPGDHPAGQSRIRDELAQLDKYRIGEEKDEYDPTSEGTPPDYRRGVEFGRQLLMTTSKNSWVAVRLLVCYTKLHGWGGALVGLKILRGLIDKCWDRLHPMPNPEDPDDSPAVRALPFEWIGIGGANAFFPQTIAKLALFAGKQNDEEGIAADDFKPPARQGQAKRYTKEEMDKQLAGIPQEATEARLKIVQECREECRAIDTALTQLLGEHAPSLSDLNRTLDECTNTLISRLPIAKNKPTENLAESVSGSSTGGESSSVGGNRPSGSLEAAVNSRSDAYELLKRAADVLEKIEPHSPIPYLIRRAVSLGAMPFPQLMRELIRNEDILTGMNRELGIKEPPADAAAPAAGYN